MNILEILNEQALAAAIADGYVRKQYHPTEPLAILNYSQKAQFDRAWNEVTVQCRGLIFNTETNELVARPWPKFFNSGEHDTLNMTAPVRIFDKMDGSLGILYPTSNGWAIATRGSFTSTQAIAASALLRDRLASRPWDPSPELTYLFEVLLPENRVVVDYGDRRELVLLDILETETGLQAVDYEWIRVPFDPVDELDGDTLAEALMLEPRENAEGVVVYFQDGSNLKVKIKQAAYLHLHRVLTGTNARNVWEWAAAHDCVHWISERKHWGTYLGMDPERAEECLALGDKWLEDLPDEFYGWVHEVINDVTDRSTALINETVAYAETLKAIPDRQQQWEQVKNNPFNKQIMRYLQDPVKGRTEIGLKAWREVTPEPVMPFAISEDVA